MKNLRTPLLAFMTLVVGMLLGGAASRAVAAPSRSGAQAAIRYFCFEAHDVDELNRKANLAAADGWVLVTGGGRHWCFTRYAPR